MSELKGKEYLKRKLATKRTRTQTRYKYYEMKKIAEDLKISTPDGLQWLNSTLGWCA